MAKQIMEIDYGERDILTAARLILRDVQDHWRGRLASRQWRELESEQHLLMDAIVGTIREFDAGRKHQVNDLVRQLRDTTTAPELIIQHGICQACSGQKIEAIPGTSDWHEKSKYGPVVRAQGQAGAVRYVWQETHHDKKSIREYGIDIGDYDARARHDRS